jgi:hypothetical protein
MANSYVTVQGPNPPNYAGNPNFGLALGQMLGQLPDSYMQGRAMGQQRELEDMFKTEKLPRNPDGSVDVNALVDKGVKTGGYPFVMKMLPFLQSQALMNRVGQDRPPTIGGDDSGSGRSYASPPAGSATGPAGVGQNPDMRGSDVQRRSDASAPNIRQMVSELRGTDTDSRREINQVGMQLHINPDADLTPQQEKLVKDFLSTKTAALGGATPATEQNGGNAAARPASGVDGSPGANNAPPFAPQGGRPPSTATGQLGQPPQRIAQNTTQTSGNSISPNTLRQLGVPEAYLDRPQEWVQGQLKRADTISKKALAAGVFGVPSKPLEERAADIRNRMTQIQKFMGEAGQLTGTQKELSNTPEIAAAAAAKKSAEETEGARAENVATRIKGIKPARDTIQVLDEMGDALARLGNTTTGAGARQVLEIKKSINNVFPGTFSNVAEAETIDKLNAQLAAAAAKSLTARPSQQEFKAFMQQNPGLNTAKETSAALVDIMRQSKVLELGLGLEADKFKPNQGKSWSEVEDQYVRSHPIISPFTHKPIDARKAPDGKWYRPNPDQPDSSKPHHWMQEPGS